MSLYLGVEFGSTRIKANTIDEAYRPVSAGDYNWVSGYNDGIWSYPIEQVWEGLKSALSKVEDRDAIEAMGVSGMMHGYMAFDTDWNLLVPFRTWQNTITGEAADRLTEELHFNIPQRWSIAHLVQAVMNGEDHIGKIAHITTLAGYVHFMLTGVNAVGIGEASGIFPIDSEAMQYDAQMLDKTEKILASYELPWKLRDVLPAVLPAGAPAGALTQAGSDMLDGLLKPGIAFCPPEGDAGTGMTATNAIAPGTGNVSAGTSIFAMVVLEKALKNVYQEIDMVTTPSGSPVAMVHCNNCTNDTNAWVGVMGEILDLFGAKVSTGDLYTKLYEKTLEGDVDCSGITVCNYLAGEGVTHLDEGRPMVVRTPGMPFNLANFFRAQLYATMSTLKIGMDILAREEVAIRSLMGHGGLFKTPVVGQSYMAAACNAPVTCMKTAGEGGPYGMAILASYMALKKENESLQDYLNGRVFCDAECTTLEPDPAAVEGFNKYNRRFEALLEVERKATEVL